MINLHSVESFQTQGGSSKSFFNYKVLLYINVVSLVIFVALYLHVYWFQWHVSSHARETKFITRVMSSSISSASSPGNPVVFFDITLGGQPMGRIKMELFMNVCPRTAENFRFGFVSLCLLSDNCAQANF